MSQEEMDALMKSMQGGDSAPAPTQEAEMPAAIHAGSGMMQAKSDAMKAAAQAAQAVQSSPEPQAVAQPVPAPAPAMQSDIILRLHQLQVWTP